MGNLMREYWLPVLLSWELKPDGPPERVRLLGEDLIAFRDSNGRPGLLAANCPHRGASLFFGRNEETGLRCVYHGWKFDVTGACVDMPSEPAESNFKHKVKATAYPCVEQAGVIWTYMGPRETPPPLPNLEWMAVPEENCILAKRVQYCNWAQALEGEIDSSHLGFTHSRVADHQPSAAEQDEELVGASKYQRRDKHPRFDVLDTDYGVVIGARRDAEEDSYYYRISQFLMPSWTLVASGTERDDPTRGTRAYIPIDDENVMVFAATFHPLRPLTERERSVLKTGGGAGYVGENHFLPPTSQPFGRWRPIAGKDNDYLMDREAQKTKLFAGIAEFWAQDAALQETMGAIYDRSKEHLGSSDTAIIRMRARLISAAKALEEGSTPPEVDAPELYRVRASVVVLPRDVSWLDATEHLRRVVPGTNPGGVEVGLPVGSAPR
jgi:phenylpropionate dioxygenase-like ring-hydroxylating dioxygenase large terminal subunit